MGEKLASKIPVNNDSYIEYLGPRQQETLFFQPVISSDVNEVICTFDQSKASGCDDLPVRMLVDAKDFVSEPLAFIMNLSFSTGILPDKFKMARVVPIYSKREIKVYQEIIGQSQFCR